MCKTEPAKPTPPSSPADPSHYADPCQACVGTILRIQLVDARDRATGIEGATIGASGKPSLTSGTTGWVRYEPIPAGSYDVFGEGEACRPARVERSGVAVPAGQTTEVVLETTPCEIRLHVDADRDGVVDANWTDGEPWRPGTGQLGAVVLVNSDRDDSGRATGQDLDNTRVDTGADLSDIAPLALRKTIPGVTFPAKYKVTLAVSAPAKLRVFDNRTGSASALVGPAPSPGQHVWGADTLGDEKLLGMEAVLYPSVAGGRDTVDLTLTMRRDARVLYTQRVTVRIAPWICYNHLFRTVRAHVLATGDNATFRGLLRTAVAAAGVPLTETPGHGGDRWMQDVMEPGFSSMPRAGGPTHAWHTPVTMRSVQTRTAEHYVRDEMLGADHGFVQGGPSVPGRPTMDSFGNLECSPPFTHRRTGRRYAFGRMVYGGGAGRRMDANNRRFLANQRVQEPFEIDTRWLQVGHVDEVVSFLPHAGSTHGYKVVLADPTRALALVRAAPASARMMTGYLPVSGVAPSGRSLADLAARYLFHTAGAFRSNAAMVALQATAQGHIDAIRATLRHELDLEDTDFITFPILFERDSPTRLIAHSPGAVNMLVVTRSPADVQLCIPKPFGPIVGGRCSFEREILATLARIGIPAARVHFIDDFATYHCLAGEVHCGTNSEREAPDGAWWWDMDWV